MNSFNFKSYFNFLSRNKGYTAVNLVGFSVSLAFVVLLGLYTRRELSMDRFHRDGGRIFQLTNDWDAFSWKIADDLRNRYPEDFEALTRTRHENMTIIRGAEKIRTGTLFVDSVFFDIFSFPILDGVPGQLFETKTDAVVTESFARRLFGDEPAVGRTIEVDVGIGGADSTALFLISGVAADFEDSHIASPDLLLRADNVPRFRQDNYENAAFVHIYLKQNPGVDFASKIPQTIEWFKEFYWPYQDDVMKELGLRPISESYFTAPKISNGTVSNSKTFILILLAAALTVLLFAVINYINLSVAQSGFRAREAATRRLLGGTRFGLFVSYILESVLFCAGALVVAFFLAGAIEPFFNRMLGSDVSINEMLTPAGIALCAAGAIVLGGVCGFFPALIVTRWKPIDVVRGEFTRKTRMVYSRIFIGVQYAITIVLLGCALTILMQTRYMRTTDLGFAKENIITMDNTVAGPRAPGLRDRLMKVPGVEAVSFTRGTPLSGGNNNTVRYEDGTSVSFQELHVDSLFWQIMGIEKISETGNAAPGAVWVNEELLRVLGLPADTTEFMLYRPEAIAGVVKDFHFRDMHQKIGPMYIRDNLSERYYPWDILVKIDSNNPGQTYRRVVDATLEYNGGMPFDSNFVDAAIDNWYDEQEKTFEIMGWFSGIAILISALGLLAMATYFMRQRARDIAVRKVFGAQNREVLNRLVFSFLKIVAVAFLIAVPVIWYAMSRWLATFAYRIPLRWTIFAVAGILAAAIAFAAVFWKSWRAANTNPVETLHKG
jgi:putative ABC transport system permease protein